MSTTDQAQKPLRTRVARHLLFEQGISAAFTDGALTAIEAASEGDWDTRILTNSGWTYTAREMVENLGLEEFVEEVRPKREPNRVLRALEVTGGWFNCHVLGHHDLKIVPVGLLRREACQRSHCPYLGRTLMPE